MGTNKTRKQLSLFVGRDAAAPLEAVRSRYNPLQQQLIAAHVTLCREDEIADTDAVIHNLEHLHEAPLSIYFEAPVRFNQGAGVLIPATANNEAFQLLRKKVLAGIIDEPRQHMPHITLLHPRNSTCTDAIYEAIMKMEWPKQFQFNAVSLIEQSGDGPWKILRTFSLQG